jgi:mannosyl-3-phosphoglycerate phosphatase
VFADLDGMLCDRARHSFEDSAAAIDLLSRRDIPLVLCSGMTRSQLERAYVDLGMCHPFVVEHGAAVLIPHGYFGDIPHSRQLGGYELVEFGAPYVAAVEALRRASHRSGVEVIGFADMSVGDVARECGLSLMEARLAKLREYDEPFRVLNAEPGARERLFRALRADHFGCLSGRQFDHVGAHVDLGKGVRLLKRLYRRAFGSSTVTIGFGIGPSHAAVLRAVDRAFVLGDENQSICADLLRIPDAEPVDGPGVVGWARTIGRLVNHIATARASIN